MLLLQSPTRCYDELLAGCTPQTLTILFGNGSVILDVPVSVQTGPDTLRARGRVSVPRLRTPVSRRIVMNMQANP